MSVVEIPWGPLRPQGISPWRSVVLVKAKAGPVIYWGSI